MGPGVLRLLDVPWTGEKKGTPARRDETYRSGTMDE
jgi:hypothetical protein